MKKENIKYILVAVVLIVFAWVAFHYKNTKVSITTTNTTFFQRSSQLNTKYITSVDAWPPKVVLTQGKFECISGGEEVTTGNSMEKTIHGRTYCATVYSEGAAGSTYTTYTYVTKVGEELAQVSFTLRAVQCANYDEPKRTECSAERTAFDPDTLADAVIMSTSN